jgi:2-dehydropantoate 2-reductase
MRTLLVGAGATGGLLGARLLEAGRDVTYLVRPSTAERLATEGLRVRGADGATRTHPVAAVTTAELRTAFDLVVVAVRGAALPAAISDMEPAVDSATRVVPLLNGMAPLDALVAAFGHAVVLGATARLGATALPDGTIVELAPGIAFELGALDRAGPEGGLEAVRRELAVDGVTVEVVDDVRAAMWAKWSFIAASTVLTCLSGGVVGDAASVAGGPELAAAVVVEVSAVAAAEGHEPAGADALVATLSDPASRFAPSLTRELWAGRPVEVEVLADLAARARRHGVASPLLDAALVRLRVGRGR